MRVTECSICRSAAAWLIGTEVLCEGHIELIIKAAGVDRFRIHRLMEAECVCQSGDQMSRTVAVKKEAQNPNGEVVRAPP